MSSTMDKIKDTLHLNKDHQKTAISTTDSHRPGTLGIDAARVPRYTDTGAGSLPSHEKSSTGGFVDSLKDNLNLSKENQYASDTGPSSTSYVAPVLNSPVGTTGHNNTTSLGHKNHEDVGFIDKAKDALSLNKGHHETSGSGLRNPSESHGTSYTTASGHQNHAGTGNVDNSFIDKAKNALNLNKDHHDGGSSTTGHNYTTGSGYTSHSAAGNEESYKDKVKSALHLGKDHQEKSTGFSDNMLPPGDAINRYPPPQKFKPRPIETSHISNSPEAKAAREEEKAKKARKAKKNEEGMSMLLQKQYLGF